MQLLQLLINILNLASEHEVKSHSPTDLALASERRAEVMCIVVGESISLPFSYLSDCKSTKQDEASITCVHECLQ